MRALLAVRPTTVASRALVIGLIALCGFGVLRVAEGALIPAKAVVAQWLLEQTFDRSSIDRQPRKPWPWADMAPVARLTMPRLRTDRIVLDSGSGQAMAFGPTLLPGASAPGQPGTTVIAAHRDTHFRFLAHVRIGDRLTLTDLDGVVRAYRVVGTQIVRWDQFALSTNDAHQSLALTTCYPFDAQQAGPLRYVVTARLITETARQHAD